MDAQQPAVSQYWQQIYSRGENVWGTQADSTLTGYASLAPQGKALDLGAGEGRNALYLAGKGYDVTGIDLSEIAIERCRERAKAMQVPVHAEVGNLVDFAIEPNTYAVIVCTLTLHFLKSAESRAVLQHVKTGLQPGGLFYMTTFTTDDPNYARLKARGATEIEPNTFLRPGSGPQDHIHYFEKDELMTQLSDLRLIYFAQGQAYDQGHVGVPEPHYHGFIEYAGQKV